MDWDKAKNLTIIFLLVLNIFLGALVYRQNSRYNLTTAQERAIFSLLAKNNISVYSNIIKEYKPMSKLIMTGYNYDSGILLNAFFEGTQTRMTVEYGKTIYKTGDANLTIQNNYVNYYNPGGMGSAALTEESARELCSQFIAKLGIDFKNFEYDCIVMVDGGYRLEYREVYNKYVVYSNFIEFTITADGIVNIDLMYLKPMGFADTSIEVVSADEALFSFMQRIKSVSESKEVFINKMDIVYYQDEVLISENSDYRAIPYYRIYISGQDTPFLINAYTNNVL